MKKLITYYLLPPLVYVVIYLICMTLRLREVGKELEKQVTDGDKPFILALWHGRLIYPVYYYRHIGKTFKNLTSPSFDGQVIARIMSLFGYGIVYGSSFQKPRAAIRELKRQVDGGSNVTLISDGSRGPYQTLQPGALMISKLTGASILPMTVSFNKYWVLPTWDRMLIPKPFSTAVVMFGEPVKVASHSGSHAIEDKRRQLEAMMIDMAVRADRYFDSE